MLNVVCVKVGDKYDNEYVYNLQKAVKNYLSIPYEFYCITDSPLEGVNCIPAPTRVKGWWTKIYLFARNNGLKGKILYLDIDQVIIGPLDKFIPFDDFMMLQDFENSAVGNSSVLLFEKKKYEYLWDNLTADDMDRYPGDQDYIFYNTKPTFYPKHWVRSWKWHIHRGGIINVRYEGTELKGEYRDEPPRLTGVSIICFHGTTKPHQIEGMLPIWRQEIS
jgi:hypothetical protein